jgi:hypothetical protein
MTNSKHLAVYVRVDKTLKCLRNLRSKTYLLRLLRIGRDEKGENKFPKARVIINRQREVTGRTKRLQKMILRCVPAVNWFNA